LEKFSPAEQLMRPVVTPIMAIFGLSGFGPPVGH